VVAHFSIACSSCAPSFIYDSSPAARQIFPNTLLHMVHDISLIRQRYASEVLPLSLLLNDSGVAPNSGVPSALCKHRHESCQYSNKCEGHVPLSKEVVRHLSNPHEHPTSITHANTHTYTHTCTHTHTCMHTHTHTHTHTHMHTHLESMILT